MTLLVNSPFTATDGTLLTAYVDPVAGAAIYKKHPSATNVSHPTIQANQVRTNTPNDETVYLYYADVVQGSSDYTVSGFATIGQYSRGVIGLRFSSTVNTGYLLFADVLNNVIGLRKYVAGSSSALGSDVGFNPGGVECYFEFAVSGGATPTLTAYVQRQSDGNWLSSSGTWGSSKVAVQTVADSSSPITAGGFAALWLVPISTGTATNVNSFAVDGTLAATGISGTINDAGGTLGGAIGSAVGSISWTVRNSANLPVINTTIPVVSVCRLNDGVQVAAILGLTTNDSGLASIPNNAALAPGQWYVVSYWRTDGTKLGLPVILQAV